jgi:hypothetical protein
VLRVTAFTSVRGSPENIMLVYLFLALSKVLERAENSRRDAYLAAAVDMIELERRMRFIEDV